MMQAYDLQRRLVAEALGTALLVATVVGSGIMAETLTKDTALALLGNTLPTGAILVVLITIFGPISGAHFNPAVSLVFALRRELSARDAGFYIAAQILGGIIGTIVAHGMFGLPLLDASLKVRTGGAQWFAEGSCGVWPDRHDTGRHPLQQTRRAVACRTLHHGGLLVHRLYIICQPSRRYRPVIHQYVFGHPPCRPSGIYRRRTVRSSRRPDRHDLVVAAFARSVAA